MTDRRTVFLVTLALALVVLGGLGGVVFLTAVGRPLPDVLSNITTTALGALGALLVSTRVDPGQLPAQRPSVADVEQTANDRWLDASLADQKARGKRG